MRDDNSNWKQQQDEEQQWLNDPIAQKEYQNWLDCQEEGRRAALINAPLKGESKCL